MPVIDAQVHVYERDHPGRPWVGTLHGPPEVTGADMVAAMDRVGVDGALLVSAWSMYRFDPSYAIEVRAAYPDRFAMVAPMDPRQDDVVDRVADWAARPAAVGIRLLFWNSAADDAGHPNVDRILQAAARHDLPVCMLAWGRLDRVDELAAAHPETRIVIDHLGLRQPFEPPPPAEPFADLPAVLALARRPNVAIKITGAATLSHRPFPFADIWDPVARIIDAYGVERCMWGTDWTRAVELVDYEAATEAFRITDRLSAGDRAALMGGTLTSVFGWAPSGRAPTH
jgi:predicted TIM-barrel fold metal-dependent hydrolase